MSVEYESSKFLLDARAYKGRLQAARSFEEVLELWKSNSIPYEIQDQNPYSPEYLGEVTSLYSELSNVEYATANEWTSDKQSPEQFELGYPWVTKNLGIISQELAKPIQAMSVLDAAGFSSAKVVEFGGGWGNLALPMAKAGLAVTVIDIDRGFLDRISRLADRESLSVVTIEEDFVDAARKMDSSYDVAIFQSSFHHCLNFNDLLQQISQNVLTDRGIILFLSEPIFHEYPFPWGLRFDGESLWAIMCNKWLELGFRHDFFSTCLLKQGLFLSEVPGFASYVGAGWKASRGTLGIPFEQWSLPASISSTFHEPQAGSGRFVTSQSLLPGLVGSAVTGYQLTVHNFGAAPLGFTITGRTSENFRISVGEILNVWVDADCEHVTIRSDMFVPDVVHGNGDVRELGVCISNIRLAHAPACPQPQPNSDPRL